MMECSAFWLLKAPSALTVIHVQVVTPGGDRCFCQSGIIRRLNTLPAEATGGQRSRASFLGLELRLRSAISGVTDVPEPPVRRAERSQRSQHSERSEPISVQSGPGWWLSEPGWDRASQGGGSQRRGQEHLKVELFPSGGILERRRVPAAMGADGS